MYICLECGNIFEEGEEWNESRGEFWGSSCFESVSGCPICKGAYEEVQPCKICGGYDKNSNSGFCQSCEEEVKKRFSDFVDNNFSKEERELLNELYEGEWI